MVYLIVVFSNSHNNYEICNKISRLTKHKILITGGPSTGKTSIINHLEQLGEKCYHEVSRDIILEAQKQGIEQLFIKDPTLFSKKLLEGRIHQFTLAENGNNQRTFIDRGIPDILAYMNYVNEENPPLFIEACKKYRYDQVFLLPPWKEIHVTDNERYESFEQAQDIYKCLLDTYTQFGYNCIEIPFGNVKERSTFIQQSVLE